MICHRGMSGLSSGCQVVCHQGGEWIMIRVVSSLSSGRSATGGLSSGWGVVCHQGGKWIVIRVANGLSSGRSATEVGCHQGGEWFVIRVVSGLSPGRLVICLKVGLRLVIRSGLCHQGG